MTRLDERLNAVQWRLRAMKRLWRGDAEPDMPFLGPEFSEAGGAGQIDYPLADAEIHGETLTVIGWAVFDMGPAVQVEIWLDDQSLGRARLGLPRPDMEEMSTLSAAAAVSGFELIANLDMAPEKRRVGTAQLRMVATATNGRCYEAEPVTVEIAPASEAPEAGPPPLPVQPGHANGGEGRRLLVVTHQLNLGGAQLYLMDLLRGLLDRGGYAPTVVSAMDGSLRGELEEMGIPVHLSGPFPNDELGPHLGRVEELATWAQPHEFELAFINTATALAFPGAEVASRLGIPAIWGIHESFEPAIIWAPLDPEVRARGRTGAFRSRIRGLRGHSHPAHLRTLARRAALPDHPLRPGPCLPHRKAGELRQRRRAPKGWDPGRCPAAALHRHG